MAETTKISWCDATFNPWIGCTKVSAGCTNCYAEAEDRRRSWTLDGWGAGRPRKLTSEAYWKQPLRWNAKAERDGVRQKVFCASLADVFDEEVPNEWRERLMSLIHQTPRLNWLLLTKRPGNIRLYLERQGGSESTPFTLPSNVWLGVTVENQAAADERIPILLQIPAAVRFLSCEPLLGAVDLLAVPTRSIPGYAGLRLSDMLHWVICGGESGPNARPVHPDWARSLRDQCSAVGVPFFFKQWGGANKKANGRLLDGVEWGQSPSGVAK